MTPQLKPSAATDRTVQHDSFVIERCFDATPSQVFAAWADPATKHRWFVCNQGNEEAREHQLDFRVGGRELNRGAMDGVVHFYDARYEDIVQDSRIIIAYTMTLGETKISASLMTVELLPEGSTTRLILTEQIAVLDSRYPVAGREEGTRELLDNLDAELRRTSQLLEGRKS